MDRAGPPRVFRIGGFCPCRAHPLAATIALSAGGHHRPERWWTSPWPLLAPAVMAMPPTICRAVNGSASASTTGGRSPATRPTWQEAVRATPARAASGRRCRSWGWRSDWFFDKQRSGGTRRRPLASPGNQLCKDCSLAILGESIDSFSPVESETAWPCPAGLKARILAGLQCL